MKLSDVFSAKSIAAYFTQAHSNELPLLGISLFPRKKKMGLDLKYIRGYKGLPVALKPSAFDVKSTFRDRIGIKIEKTQMAYFKESFLVDEEDEQEILRVQEANDPYAQAVLDHIYSDSDNLITSADISCERMIWQVIAPVNGKPSIEVVDNGVNYTYDFDEDNKFKSENFIELTGTSMWSDIENSDPFEDIQKIKDKALAKGHSLKMMVVSPITMNNLVKNKKVHSYILAQNSTANVFMSKNVVTAAIKTELQIDILVYEKMFKDSDGTDKRFCPDQTATFLSDALPGNLWYGTSPIERQALASKDSNVSQINTGVNVMVSATHDPENTKVTVDMISLPSCDNLDSVFVIKHSA